jgi:hypothetical protein
VNDEEVCDGEQSLEDLELYVYTSRHAVIHRLDDRKEGDCAQGDEALEGAEGNGENFGTFRCAPHEDVLYTSRLS